LYCVALVDVPDGLGVDALTSENDADVDMSR
jgi:hypothetical protein